MKIIVSIKQVPDTSGKVAVNPDGTLNRASMQTITNPDDMNAVEAAPEIKEAMVKKYSMKNCKRCYILADASKFDQLSSVKFADFEQATILTTELYKPALKKYKNIVEVKE